MRDRRMAYCRSALVIGVSCLVGCQALNHPSKPGPSILSDGASTPITAAQEADAQIALGRVAEQRGDFDQAMGAYRGALDRDRHRADAYQRLAVLHDKQGKFRESAALYVQALKADPGNPDVYCDMGYSLYLQRRWAESEMNLKQAITRDPKHQRAHSNLGLVLVHNARPEDAVAEFRKGGCDEAEARENVAFALTTDKRWDEARKQYRLALRARPDSKNAQARLKELETLVAKVEAPRGSGANRDPGLAMASAPERQKPAAAIPAAARIEPAPRAAPGRTSPSPASVAAARSLKPNPGAAPTAARRSPTTPGPGLTVADPGWDDRGTMAVPTAPRAQPPAEPAPK
ncbi:MAG: hypothetical protein QOE66_2078 [Chloroflexota bacterium]|nr:hypothetical protein [Chloroflexota bacterium]